MILQAPWILFCSWLRLHRTGYQKTLEYIDRLPDIDLPKAEQASLARETAFALAIAIKAGPWWPRCLTRSLTLAWLLKQRGVPFVIRIGVPNGAALKQENKPVAFSAHAWVEHDGIVLNDRPDIASQFSAFDSGAGSA